MLILWLELGQAEGNSLGITNNGELGNPVGILLGRLVGVNVGLELGQIEGNLLEIIDFIYI